jgi:hypothetical protein
MSAASLLHPGLLMCARVGIIVMFVVMRPIRRLHAAVQAIHGTILVLMRVAFKLNGGVSDLILLCEHGFQPVEDGSALTWREISVPRSNTWPYR